MIPRFVMLLVSALLLAGSQAFAGQELQIGIIDFYGLQGVSPVSVREALTFKEGDTISVAGDDRPAMFAESEARVSRAPGVVRARMNLVCCDHGGAIVYVGIEEDGAATLNGGQAGGR